MSAETRSVWENTAPALEFPKLREDIDADVAIVGGGITGITAALYLSRAGKSVVVLEGRTLGLGTTGYSTGNLYATVDGRLARLRDTYGLETATRVAQSRAATIEAIEHTVADLKIACGFIRCPQYLIATESAQLAALQAELEVAREVGLSVSSLDTVPLPIPAIGAIKIDNQAQFHPLLYIQGVAQAVASENCRIFENTRITARDGKLLTTAHGIVRAEKIVLATHTPIGFHILQTELSPNREYGIAARLRPDFSFPAGIFWTLDEPGYSVRRVEVEGTIYLVVIGEKHKTGQHDEDTDYYQRVEAFARAHFPVEAIAHRWSAQHYRSADALPYIGRSGEFAYLATGFGTNGLVYGPLAAALITDDILERENPWSDLYNARRFAPVRSASAFLQENVNVAQQYLRDYLMRADVEQLENIGPDEGALTEINGKKYAVSRDAEGKWSVLSPVCTHLGCLVHWNQLEKTWDCPCHGSRFDCQGEVLEGPALARLEKNELIEPDELIEPYEETLSGGEVIA